jgi:glucan phosphorylase
MALTLVLQAVPRVCVIGGKAASAYDMAKRIIRLTNAVGKVGDEQPAGDVQSSSTTGSSALYS